MCAFFLLWWQVFLQSTCCLRAWWAVWVRGTCKLWCCTSGTWCCCEWTTTVWIDWEWFNCITAILNEINVHFCEFHHLTWTATWFTRVNTLQQVASIAACTSQSATIIDITWISLSASTNGWIWIEFTQRALAFSWWQWIDRKWMR